MPFPARIATALAAFPAGWAVREAAGGTVGGLVVLALIAATAAGAPARRAAWIAALGVVWFAVVHLVAVPTAIYAGLAVGAIGYAVTTARLLRPRPAA